ncbi:PucR family transcriptional regulator [Conexibacter woesei]|uniref:PucR family transcriptional regulator n=1 Tax=Conexibacter woesei TaxID=191495 RepID=UPI000407C16A|nr:helix-turn-helix domain-containing protein [Conexibacter woesei]
MSARSTARKRETTVELHHEALNALAVRMRAELPAMVEETIAVVLRDHADLAVRVGAADVRIGIGHTHERFVRILEGSGDDDGGANVAFGAAAAAVGASVEGLMAGYRVGAQVGWQRVLRIAEELDLPGPVALHVASLSMNYMDELTANSLEGFAREAEAAQGARARARQALLDALLDGAESDHTMLAAAAGWVVPERVRVAVLLAAETRRLDDRTLLLGRAGGVAVAVSGDEGALDHVACAAGPEVAVGEAARSLHGARRLAELVVDGVLPGETTLRWEDHLAELVVHADRDAAQTLADVRLAPLRDASPAREALLRETLVAWLDHPGRPREIARDLHLHHQTVRYRLARLRERLGDDALDDPQQRFELQLALRATRPRS